MDNQVAPEYRIQVGSQVLAGFPGGHIPVIYDILHSFRLELFETMLKQQVIGVLVDAGSLELCAVEGVSDFQGHLLLRNIVEARGPCEVLLRFVKHGEWEPQLELLLADGLLYIFSKNRLRGAVVIGAVCPNFGLERNPFELVESLVREWLQHQPAVLQLKAGRKQFLDPTHSRFDLINFLRFLFPK